MIPINIVVKAAEYQSRRVITYIPPYHKADNMLYDVHMLLNATKGSSCLLLRKLDSLSNRRFNKLSNDTKFVKIEVILLKIQVLQSVNYFLYILHTVWFAE